MNKMTVEINGEVFRLVKGNSDELTCPKCALYNICHAVDACCVAFAIDAQHPYDYYFVRDTPPQDPYPDDIDPARFREAVKAASNFANYRKYHGCTVTHDDFFVDGVIWADKNPKWSEKDEYWKKKAIVFMKHPDMIKASPTLVKDTIDWIKSLGPQDN